MADGVIIDVGNKDKSGAGNYIVIKHGNGYISAYFHLKDKPNFNIGDTIDAGQQVGIMGKTGEGIKDIHGHLEITRLSPDQMKLTDEQIATLFWTSEGKKQTRINPREIIGNERTKSTGSLQEIANGKDVLEFGLTGKTVLKQGKETGMIKGLIDKVKSFLGFSEPYYNDSYFKTMDKYEKWKGQFAK
jgi:hypothetical protein